MFGILVSKSLPITGLESAQDDGRGRAGRIGGEAIDIAEAGRGVVLREYGRRYSETELYAG
jgi:hypothetical protein